MNIVKEIVDKKAMRRIPKTMIIKLNMVIVRDQDDQLLAFTDKITEDKKLYLNFVFSRDIKFKKVDKRKVLNMLKEYNSERESMLLNDNHIERELDKILEDAVRRGSSDIHIEPELYYTNIRYRVNGELIIVDRISKEEYSSIVNRIKVLADMDIANRLEPKDGKMFASIGVERFDIRVSSMPTTNGEKIVLRVLYKDENLNKIENLNFSNKQLNDINKLLSFKKGMIVINGPTGSGKSTTLYALLNELDKEKYNICTIEDPVEFEIPLITQSNINEKIGFNFAKALKYILRQDPDVILIGEIRDEETAKMAVRSAITGHKVLSTIHTSSGKEVYSRLLNMGVDSYLLEDSLIGVITQRLIKTLCDDCKVEHKYEIDGVIRVLYRECGCDKCNGTGYSGRIAISEVVNLTGNKEIAWGKELLSSAKKLVVDGKITFDDYILFKDGEGISDSI